MTFNEYAKSWLSTRAALETLGPAGVDMYDYACATLSPLLLGPLCYLTKADAEQALVVLKKRGLSNTTVRIIHGRASKILDCAVADGVIQVNPFANAQRPKAKSPKTKTIHEPELRKFLEAVRYDLYGTLIRFAVLTGARRGEIAGLRWEDIDFDAGTARIWRTKVCSRSAGLTVKQPKTRASVRWVALPAQLVEELRALPRVSPYVFGERHPNRLSTGVKERLRQHGLGEFTLHDLRHAHATLLLRNKENPKAVARRLGHADVGTTLRIYGHVMDEDDSDLAAAAGRLLE